MLRAQGTPIPENDIWIAALARQHTLRLVSRDTHFDGVPGLDVVRWEDLPPSPPPPTER